MITIKTSKNSRCEIQYERDGKTFGPWKATLEGIPRSVLLSVPALQIVIGGTDWAKTKRLAEAAIGTITELPASDCVREDIMRVFITDDAVCVEDGGKLYGPWKLETQPPTPDDRDWTLRCRALRFGICERELERARVRAEREVGMLTSFPKSDWELK